MSDTNHLLIPYAASAANSQFPVIFCVQVQ